MLVFQAANDQILATDDLAAVIGLSLIHIFLQPQPPPWESWVSLIFSSDTTVLLIMMTLLAFDVGLLGKPQFGRGYRTQIRLLKDVQHLTVKELILLFSPI